MMRQYELHIDSAHHVEIYWNPYPVILTPVGIPRLSIFPYLHMPLFEGAKKVSNIRLNLYVNIYVRWF